MTDEKGDIFNVEAQAAFIRGFGMDLARGSKKYQLDKDETALNPIDATDTIRSALESANVSEEYMNAVTELKNDPDVQQAVSIFSKALNGEEDILKLNDMVPRAENSKSKGFIALVDDPGLNGAVLKGTIHEDGQSDLVHYSNYISGAGTTFGGFMADLPGTVSDLQEGVAGTALFRYNKLEGQLKKNSHDLKKVIKKNDGALKKFLIDPEDAFRKQKPYKVSLDPSLPDIEVRKESTRTRLLRETFNANVKVEQAKIKNRGKLGAQKMLGKVGTGLGVATTAFGLGMGGVDVAAGDEMIDNAQKRLESNEITQDQYNKLMRDARLRIAQGTFGIGDGINNIRALVVEKLGDRVKTFSKGAKMGLRFASAVGGAFAIGMGITSIAKNAIAADDAAESGNVGKAAMYGIMAALDCVSVILDGASMILDFVPVIGQAISFVVDLVNTIVGVVNMLIGFFADMVDTRTPMEKLRESFNAHIESEEFQTFLRNQEKIYKDQGYDVLQFIIDAEALGDSEEGANPTEVYKSLMSALSAEAEKDLNDEDLRIAIIDKTMDKMGRTLKGRSNDDLIRAGIGNDTLYGKAGDDILFGETGDDTIFGGPGNDFLSGDTGKNFLHGNAGDDFLSFRPGIDALASGDEGIDTLQLVADFFVDEHSHVSKFENGLLLPESLRNRVYVDLSPHSNGKGHAGISLGALLYGVDMLNNKMHLQAFGARSYFKEELLKLFEANTVAVEKSSINEKYLWYLAWDYGSQYLTDGEYVYCYAAEQDGTRAITRAFLNFATIVPSEAVYEEDENCMKYDTNPFFAALSFAFLTPSSVSGIENIILDDDVETTSQLKISANIIGDENLRMVDLKGGDNEYVYTGDGNTVVMFSLCCTLPYEIMKYIVGGSGDNVLIINGKNILINRGQGRSPMMNQCILLDHDIDLPQADHTLNRCNKFVWPYHKDKVDRAVFIKNMQTIQISSTSDVTHWFAVDAINLSAGHRFIVDSYAMCDLVGSQGDDSVSLKRLERGHLDGHKGRNVLSLDDSDISVPITIDLGTGKNAVGSVTGDSIHIYLYRFQSVQGHTYVSGIKGNDLDDNLLVANGGQCTIEARAGKNIMISKRGRHTLAGGTGQDSYELFGPNPLDFVLVSITKMKDEKIVASARDGIWNEAGNLCINILKDESESLSIDSTSVTVVDSSGKLAVSNDMVQCEARTITFTPGNAFDDLKRDRSCTIRIEYTTEGSLASIIERSKGNRLKLHSVSDQSEMKVRIDEDYNLEFTTASQKAIFKDLVWGDMYRSGVTSLEILASDFSERFPVLQMSGTNEKTETNMMVKAKIYQYLVDELSPLKNASTTTVKGILRQMPTVFDSMLDTKDSKAVEFLLGVGKNVLLGRRRKVTYRTEKGENIVNLSYLGSAADGTMDRTFVDAVLGGVVVAISVDTFDSDPVAIRFTELDSGIRQGSQGKKNLVIKGTLPSTVRAVSWTEDSDMKWGLVDTSVTNQTKPFVVMDDYPDVMLFSDSIGDEEVHILVDDVIQFWTTKLEGGAYASRRAYNSTFEQQLDLSFLQKPYNFSLSLAPGPNWLEVALLEKNIELYKFSFEFHSVTTLDAIKIAQRIRGQFPRGIILNDETYMAPEIRRLVMDCFQAKKYEIIGGGSFSQVVRSSTVAASYRLPDGNAFILADREGGRIYGGRGNHYIQVMKSNITVGAGECDDDGRSVIEIGEGVTETMLTLSANTYLIFNGWAAYTLRPTFRTKDPLGGYLPSTFSKNDAFVILRAGTVIARLNRAPSYLLFRDSERVGVVDDVLLFCRESGRWEAKFYIDSSRRVKLSIPNVEKSTFHVGAKGKNVWLFSYDPRYDSPVRTIAIFSIGSILATNSRSGYSISHAATAIETYMPGGIFFHDGWVFSRDLDSFMREAMARNTSFSAITYLQDDHETTLTYEDTLKYLNPHQHLYDVLDVTVASFTISNIDLPGKIVRPPADVTEEVRKEESAEVTEGRTSNAPIIISQLTYPSTLPESKKVPTKKMAVTWKGFTYFAFEPTNSSTMEVYLVGWDGSEWGPTFTAGSTWTFTGMSKNEDAIIVHASWAPHGSKYFTKEKLWTLSAEDGRDAAQPVILSRVTYPQSLPESSLKAPQEKVAVTWKGTTYFPFCSNDDETEVCFVQWNGTNWGRKITCTRKGRFSEIISVLHHENIYVRLGSQYDAISTDLLWP